VKGRRPQVICEIAGDRSVLDVALDVHETAHGSYDRSTEAQDGDVLCLRHVLEHWHPTLNERAREFDDAVRALIVIALKEHARWEGGE
jgi:hypothetical protein